MDFEYFVASELGATIGASIYISPSLNTFLMATTITEERSLHIRCIVTSGRINDNGVNGCLFGSLANEKLRFAEHPVMPTYQISVKEVKGPGSTSLSVLAPISAQSKPEFDSIEIHRRLFYTQWVTSDIAGE